MMERRLYIVGILSLFAAPLAKAQSAEKVYRIGLLSGQTAESTPPRDAFRQKLRELGYAEGRNLAIEYRWAAGKYDRLPGLARELVRLPVDLIVAPDGVAPTLAAKAATRTIPVVFFAGDAVESGLVQTLAHPGGNLTGVSGLTAGLDVKRLEILKEAVPTAVRVAMLWNPENPTGVPQRNRMVLAAETLRIQPRMLEARSPSEIDAAVAVAARERLDALLVLADPMLSQQRKRIVDLAARARLPVGAMFRPFAEVGALVSYGPDLAEIYRHLAVYAAKILSGAKPGDLPVEEPTKYELVINLKTAKALGLTIPPSVLARADEVIQ
jgi:putative ABC transport system substrate-binding protein